MNCIDFGLSIIKSKFEITSRYQFFVMNIGMYVFLQVGIVAFSDSAETPPGRPDTSGCYRQSLAVATPQNKKYLSSYIKYVRGGGATDYHLALEKAFALVRNADSISGDRGMLHIFKPNAIYIAPALTDKDRDSKSSRCPVRVK